MNKASIKAILYKPVSATNLALLRFCFGVLMIMMLTNYLSIAEVFWQIHSAIPFPGLEFIKPLEQENMELLLYIGIAAAFFTAIGFLFRYSCIVLTLILTLSVLMTRVAFNNHYYLFALIGFLLIFTNADERFSVKSWFRKKGPRKIPYWQYFILQFQLFIVFFHGGIAKINPDWLSGAVMDPMIWSAFGMFELLPEVSLAFSWTGMLFDLLIGFFLFWKPTRFVAVIATVVFNLMNGLLLFDDIGLFPYTMIAVTVLLFLNFDFINDKVEKLNLGWLMHREETGLVVVSWRLIWAPLLVVYFIFQLLFPLRHYLIEGNPDWTGQASCFAWRMKSNAKLIKLQFKAIDKKTGKFVSDVNMGFSHRHEQIYGYTPYSVWFMARRVYRRFEQRGRTDFGVTVDYFVAMNGQPLQRAIDPNVDLSEVAYLPYGKNTWILPWVRKSREEIQTIQNKAIERLTR